MIQFNLLPDVKLQYIKSRRIKRLVILFSTAIAAFSLAVFIMLFVVVNGLQVKHINDLNEDIKKSETELKNISNLDKILTIQNQLSSLSDLHDKKMISSRLFGYLTQVTPAQVSIGQISVDFDGSTINLSGGADSIASVNKYVDTLKFTKFTVTGGDGSEKNVFSDVVLLGFSRDEGKATYQISTTFDPAIFDATSDIKLNVPADFITTRSELEKPTELFQDSPKKQ